MSLETARTPNAPPAGWAQRHKPQASARAQLALAASMWTLVGAGLATAGTIWTSHLAPGWRATVLAGAVLVGAVKARWVLARTARRIAERIVARGDGRCAGGLLSWRSWLLVVAMAAGGRLLRATALPRSLLGVLYVAVGAALLLASSIPWRRWWRLRQPA